MTVPEVYRPGGPDLNLQVDFFDFASGAGYKAFYPCAGKNSAGIIYFLTADSTLIADPSVYQSVNADVNLDFDITFNNSITIAAAQTFINYGVSINDTREVDVDFNIYHVRNAVETLIGSTLGDTVVGPGSGTESRNKANQCLMTRTKFKKGDILRFNMITTVGGTGTAANVAFDPSGHVTGTDNAGGTWSTRLKVNVPFEVN